MKLQKVLINILLCLCLEIAVSICGNEETDDKGEQTTQAAGDDLLQIIFNYFVSKYLNFV